MAWLPLEEGPIPVAMDTKEKGRPEEVQVEEPELMGAMSAEEAGDAVGLRRSPAAEGKKNTAESINEGPNMLLGVIFLLPFPPFLDMPCHSGCYSLKMRDLHQLDTGPSQEQHMPQSYTTNHEEKKLSRIHHVQTIIIIKKSLYPHLYLQWDLLYLCHR